MAAVLGSEINIKRFDQRNSNTFECYIANDNSNGQAVASGFKSDLNKFVNYYQI